MKFSKKLLALVLAVLCLFTCSLPVLATEEEGAAALTVTPSATTVAPGETFTVTVALVNNPGLWSLMFNMAIDATVFDVVSVDASVAPFAQIANAMFDASANTVKVNMYNNNAQTGEPQNVTIDGIVVVITLKALESAALTDYTLTAEVSAENTINAVPVKVAVADGSATITVKELASEITKADVSLGTDVTVNYYATLANGQTDAQMVFTMNEKTTTVDAVATETNGLYRFPFEKVAPQCMGDNIKAELKLGETVLDTYDGFSVRAYCDQVVAMDAATLGISEAKKAALNTLTADLLAYGAAAQTYRNYKTTTLANADFAVAASAYPGLSTDDWSIPTDGDSTEKYGFAGAGVYYNNINALYIMFTAEGYTDKNFALRVTNNDTGDVLLYKLSELQEPTDEIPYYTFLGDGISALNFDTFYIFELCTVNALGRVSTVLQTAYYSVNTYACNMQNKTGENGELTAMALLARATYNYGAAAEAYAAAV
ncbi:MAG: hypothetical protein IJY20_05570 [Clostridia bacterium]|nr:hypothetical protein [Clostridia bacterium]